MFGLRRRDTETIQQQPVVVREPQPVIDAPGQPVATVVQPAVVAPTVTETTVPSRWDEFRLAVSERVQDIFWFLYSIAALLIIARFCLLAFAANPATPFAQATMSLSAPVVGPFLGLFADPSVPYVAHFELADILALFVYGIITALVCRLVALLLSPRMPTRRIIVTRD